MVSSTSSSGTNSLRRMVMRAPLITCDGAGRDEAGQGVAWRGLAGHGEASIMLVNLLLGGERHG